MDYFQVILENIGLKQYIIPEDDNITKYITKIRNDKSKSGYYAMLKISALNKNLLSIGLYNRDINKDLKDRYKDLCKKMIIEGDISFDTLPIIIIDKFKQISYGIVGDGQHRLLALKEILEEGIPDCPTFNENYSIEVKIKEVSNKGKAIEIIKRNNPSQIPEDKINKIETFSNFIDKLEEIEKGMIKINTRRPFIDENLLNDKFCKKINQGYSVDEICKIVSDTNHIMKNDFKVLTLKKYQEKYNAIGYNGIKTAISKHKLIIGIDNLCSYMDYNN